MKNGRLVTLLLMTTLLFAIPNTSFALRADNIRGNVNIFGWLNVFQNFTAGNSATDTNRFNGKSYFSANGAVVDSGPHTFLGTVTLSGGFAGATWFNDSTFFGDLVRCSSFVYLKHGGYFVQDTNNIILIGENSENIRFLFASNRVTMNTNSAAILDITNGGDFTVDKVTVDTLTDGTMQILAGNFTAVKRITADWLTLDTLNATSGVLTGMDRVSSDTLTDGTLSIIGGRITAGKYALIDTLTFTNGATIINGASDTLSFTETNVKINGKLNSSGDVVFKAGGQFGDSVGDTYAMYGWQDWGWREIADPAVHGEAVRCALKIPAGVTGSQFQAGFFAMQNKYSTPAAFMLGGLEGKATASAPTQYIRGLRGGVVAKDSGTCDNAIAINAYSECLSGATIDTLFDIYISDNGAWAGTVTDHYGIYHRAGVTVDCGIYHNGTFTADFDASDNDFTVAGEIVGDTITTSYLKLDGNILSTVQARGSHFTITIDGAEFYLAKDSTFFSK